MADLNVTVDMSDVQKLQTALGDLGPAFGRAVARIKREEQLLKASTKASADAIKKALDEVVGAKAQRDLEQWGAAQRKRLSLMEQSEKMAQRETAAILKQRSAMESLAAANAKAYQSQIGGNLGLGAQGISAGASASAFEGEMERLRSKYDQIYASSKRYEASLDEINRAHMLGALNAKQHEMAVERLNQEFAMSGSGAAFASGRMSEWGVVTQQAGYQIGDFLVQVQSGTNWMVAFGQQATQLVGTLPLVAGQLGMTTAAAIGLSTALGIGIPLVTALGAMWMRTSQDGEAAATKMEEALKRLGTETDNLAAKWSNLKFGNEDGQTMENLAIQIQMLDAELKDLEAQRAVAGGRQIGILEDQLELKREAFQLAIKDLAQLSEANNKRAAAAAQLAKAEEINARMVGLNDAILMAMAKQEGAIKRGADRLAEGERYAESIKSILESIGGMQLNVGLNIQAKVSGLPEFATGLWDKLGELGRVGAYQSSGRGTINPDSTDAMLAGLNSGMLLTSQQTGGSGGGGGGGAGNARLESLISELQTESETLAIWYEESQTALQAASDAELSILGGKHEAMLRLKEEYMKRSSEIDEMQNKWSLESAMTGAADIFGALGAFNKKALKAQAVFAAGAALISTYQGAAKELEKGTFGFATAAAVIAKGLGFVAAIKSAGEGSTSVRGASGGRGSSSVPPQQAAAPTPQTVYIDSLDPGGLYSGQTLINLFDALYDENDRRGKVFVVGR